MIESVPGIPAPPPGIEAIGRLHLSRTTKATFAVGIFEALDALRVALIDLVSLGYQQKHLILLHPIALALDEPDARNPGSNVKKLVTPVASLPATSGQHVDFDPPDDVPGETHDVSLVLDVQSWLASRHFDNLVEALRNEHNVLFVRIHQQRQIAPTCSILLSHCTQQVNTHEVALDSRHLN